MPQNIECSCKLEQPCKDHLAKALGDKIIPSDNITLSIPAIVPSWLGLQFQLWHDGKIPESDFLQSIQYMAKQGIILVNGKNLYEEPKSDDNP